MISKQPTTTAGIFPSESDSLLAAYTSYEQLKSLTQGMLGLSIMYGHHLQRIRQKYVDEATVTAILKLWDGACEYITHNGQTTILTYLSRPDGLYGLHRILPDGSSNIHYCTPITLRQTQCRQIGASVRHKCTGKCQA
ncbi:MAG: hypothetical protein PHG67_14440 [Bacteroidales bacterium]|jgi:hypothetical protein|nr:hypothetical protein [Bacteroidales bacterium]